jgi:predicted nucleic acid-binding protein
LLLPAIVIAEIGGAPEVRGDQLPKPERDGRIAKALAWIRDAQYVVAELSEGLARRAAHLGTEHHLKGADATVLATAEQWGCGCLYTRDGSLLKLDGQLGFRIAEPDEIPEPEPDLFDGIIRV